MGAVVLSRLPVMFVSCPHPLLPAGLSSPLQPPGSLIVCLTMFENLLSVTSLLWEGEQAGKGPVSLLSLWQAQLKAALDNTYTKQSIT